MRTMFQNKVLLMIKAPVQAKAKYREQVARIKADLFSSRPDSLKLSMKERTINTLGPKNRNVLLTYFNIAGSPLFSLGSVLDICWFQL